jgi:hypothetical protein
LPKQIELSREQLSLIFLATGNDDFPGSTLLFEMSTTDFESEDAEGGGVHSASGGAPGPDRIPPRTRVPARFS